MLTPFRKGREFLPENMEELDLNLQQQKENCTTTSRIVLSVTHASQRSGEVSKASIAEEHPIPGSIIRFIARIHQLFKDVERIGKPLQKISPDVAELVPKVQIQQIAFDNCCKVLLVTAAKSRQDVNNMIEDPDHPVWKDRIAHQNLEKLMARFYHICVESLDHFQHGLKDLQFELQALKEQEKDKNTRRRHIWRERSKWMALSTTEDLPDLVQNLRNYNDIFCTLVWQAVPRRSSHMLGSKFAEDSGYPYTVRAASATVSHHDLDCIQRVLQVFYDTISDSWTCSDHSSHSLGILLKFDHAKTSALVQSKGFRFIIAVTSPYLYSPYHFVVYSPYGGFSSGQTVEEDRSLQETRLGNNPSGDAVRSKPLDSSSDRAGEEGGGTFRLPELMEASKQDLRLAADLCYCLRSLSATTETEGETGYHSPKYLESRSGLRFLLSPSSKGRDQRQGSHSLDDILWRVSSEGRAIPIEDRLRTASSLAAGILHLHTSSWLPGVWSSKDIYYFDIDDYGRCALGEPFLQTPLEIHRSRRSVVEGTDSTAIRSSLLCLGLVLIELAFSAPWQRLQIQEDLTNKLSTGEKDFLDMMRLSKTVSRQLGPRYAKVVQACLSQGEEAQRTQDLRKAEVDGFIEEVVKELDECLSVVTSDSGLFSRPSMRSFSNGSTSTQYPLRPKTIMQKLQVD